MLCELVLLRGREALEMLGHRLQKLGVIWVRGSGAFELQVLYERRLGRKAPLGLCTQPLLREACFCKTPGEGLDSGVLRGDGCRLRGASCLPLSPTERVSSRIGAVFRREPAGLCSNAHRVPAAARTYPRRHLR